MCTEESHFDSVGSVAVPGVGKGAFAPFPPKKIVLPLNFEWNQEKMSIFLYKVVKTDDFLRVLPPLKNVLQENIVNIHRRYVKVDSDKGGRQSKIAANWKLKIPCRLGDSIQFICHEGGNITFKFIKLIR